MTDRSLPERRAEIRRLVDLYGATTPAPTGEVNVHVEWLLVERHQTGEYYASWWSHEESAIRWALGRSTRVADLVNVRTGEESAWIS